MNNKKNALIGFLSLVITIIALIVLFSVLVPLSNRAKAFKLVQDGEARKAKRYINEFTESQRDDFEEDLKDYIVYVTNQYIDGDISYGEARKALLCVENLKSFKGITGNAFARINAIEIDRFISAKAKNSKDGNYDYDDVKVVNDLYRVYDGEDDYFYSNFKNDYSEFIEKYLDNKIEAKYTEYCDGKKSYEEMRAYTYILEASRIHSSKVMEVENKLYYDSLYNEELKIAQGYIDSNEYFSAIDLLKSDIRWYENDDSFKDYKKKFLDLYNTAYDEGEKYYLAKAKEYAEAGQFDELKKIYMSLKDVYGDDIDDTEIQNMIHQPWMDAYIEFMKDWEKNLKTDVATGVKIGDYFDSSTVKVDSYKPDEICLADLDGDNIPELILSYISVAYIYTYDGSKVVFTGVFQYYGITEDNKVIISGSIPVKDADSAKLYQLLKFDKGKWTAEKTAVSVKKGDQTVYKVDGKDSDEANFKTTSEGINGTLSKYYFSNSRDISEYERLIRMYGLE